LTVFASLPRLPGTPEWHGGAGRKTMVRRTVLSLGLVAVAVGLSGCFSLNMDENVRQINHYGKSADELRKLTNKYFFDYDQDDPFED
jgi:hypothetical protein